MAPLRKGSKQRLIWPPVQILTEKDTKRRAQLTMKLPPRVYEHIQQCGQSDCVSLPT